MLKKILYWLMVVVIVAGAVYSYKKVGFGRSTAMLFQVAFGDANSMGGPGGRPPMGGNMQEGQMPGLGSEGGRGQMPSGEAGSQYPSQIQQGVTGGQAPNFQTPGEGMQGGGFPPGGEGGQRANFQPGGEGGQQRPQGQMDRPGGPGGQRSTISLRNVIPYTFILAFFVLITYLFERCIKRFSGSKGA